jgi:hypothetical protein
MRRTTIYILQIVILFTLNGCAKKGDLVNERSTLRNIEERQNVGQELFLT